MSNSDFLKHLFLAAVESGQIQAGSAPDEATQVMSRLMSHYLQAAQEMGRMNRRVRRRVGPATTGRITQDAPSWSDRRGGALPS